MWSITALQVAHRVLEFALFFCTWAMLWQALRTLFVRLCFILLPLYLRYLIRVSVGVVSGCSRPIIIGESFNPFTLIGRGDILFLWNISQHEYQLGDHVVYAVDRDYGQEIPVVHRIAEIHRRSAVFALFVSLYGAFIVC